MSVVSFIAFIHFIRRAWFLARPAGRPAGAWFVAGRPASWCLVFGPPAGRPAGWLAGCEIAGRTKLAIFLTSPLFSDGL